jgi:hypothetical protein
MRCRDQEAAPPRSRKLLGSRGPSILGDVRRLGWFLVGAAGATGALVAAPGLYGRLRAALGGDDVWNELEPEPDQQWGVLREAPPIGGEPEPPAEEAPVAEAEPEPEPAEEAEPEAEQPAAAAEPEAEPETAAPEPEADTPAEPDAYETSVWSRPARVADAPAEEAATAEPREVPHAEAAPAAAPGEEDADDDTAEIPPKPLTAAPPPEDTTASALRSRIEASRARLHRKVQEGAAGDAETDDEPDEPDSGA